jgi:hypothetical protein
VRQEAGSEPFDPVRLVQNVNMDLVIAELEIEFMWSRTNKE